MDLNKVTNEILKIIIELVWPFVRYSVTRAILFSFLGLIISIIILIVFTKLKLFKRDNKIWNIFVKINYAYIPIIFIIFGTSFGIKRGTHLFFSRNIDTMIELSRPYLEPYKKYLENNMEDIAQGGMSLKEITVNYINTNLYYKPKSDNFFEIKKARIINFIILNSQKWFLTGVITVAVEFSDMPKPGKKAVKDVISLINKMDFSEIDKSVFEIVVKGIKRSINSHYRKQYLKTLIFLMIFFNISLAEIVMYKLVFRKMLLKRKNEKLENIDNSIT